MSVARSKQFWFMDDTFTAFAEYEQSGGQCQHLKLARCNSQHLLLSGKVLTLKWSHACSKPAVLYDSILAASQ